ncbi:hypothetical protein PFLUV_G00101590 [Perca fluviatilis]|uniref:Secreted protein n=1 Tax=Perca fluviatilis TaxID=8168 RepID=A0A6A5FC58_PERFL|nr:hypothetical protein PFLUV_G00101590 [Perca fluviatilis]
MLLLFLRFPMKGQLFVTSVGAAVSQEPVAGGIIIILPALHHGCPRVRRCATAPKWLCGQRHQPTVRIQPAFISTLWKSPTC